MRRFRMVGRMTRGYASIAALLLAVPLLVAWPVGAEHTQGSARYITGGWYGAVGLIAQCQGPGGIHPDGIGGACSLTPPTRNFTVTVIDDELGPRPFFWEARDDQANACPAQAPQQGTGEGTATFELDAACSHVTVFVWVAATRGSITLS